MENIKDMLRNSKENRLDSIEAQEDSTTVVESETQCDDELISIEKYVEFTNKDNIINEID